MNHMTLETRRNLFHLIVGILIVAAYYYMLIDIWVVLGAVLVGFLISAASKKRPLPVIQWFLDRFEREGDIDAGIPGRGALSFGVGLLLTMILFERDVVLAAITIFIIADSVSPLVGMRFGRIRHPLSGEKFLEGNMAGFLAAFLGAMLFVSPVEAFLASLFAMTIEAIDFIKGTRIEDNITIPLVAGITVMLLRLF
jgi:dolichol kinase